MKKKISFFVFFFVALGVFSCMFVSYNSYAKVSKSDKKIIKKVKDSLETQKYSLDKAYEDVHLGWEISNNLNKMIGTETINYRTSNSSTIKILSKVASKLKSIKKQIKKIKSKKHKKACQKIWICVKKYYNLVYSPRGRICDFEENKDRIIDLIYDAYDAFEFI